MKANEFIKKFGLKLAQRDIAALDSGFIKHDDFLEHYGFDILDDLKRLVESHELVEECGGLDKAKERVALEEKLLNPNVFYVLVVSSAIDDVESCQ